MTEWAPFLSVLVALGFNHSPDAVQNLNELANSDDFLWNTQAFTNPPDFVTTPPPPYQLFARYSASVSDAHMTSEIINELQQYPLPSYLKSSNNIIPLRLFLQMFFSPFSCEHDKCEWQREVLLPLRKSMPVLKSVLSSTSSTTSSSSSSSFSSSESIVVSRELIKRVPRRGFVIELSNHTTTLYDIMSNLSYYFQEVKPIQVQTSQPLVVPSKFYARLMCLCSLAPSADWGLSSLSSNLSSSNLPSSNHENTTTIQYKNHHLMIHGWLEERLAPLAIPDILVLYMDRRKVYKENKEREKENKEKDNYGRLRVSMKHAYTHNIGNGLLHNHTNHTFRPKQSYRIQSIVFHHSSLPLNRLFAFLGTTQDHPIRWAVLTALYDQDQTFWFLVDPLSMACYCADRLVDVLDCEQHVTHERTEEERELGKWMESCITMMTMKAVREIKENDRE